MTSPGLAPSEFDVRALFTVAGGSLGGRVLGTAAVVCVVDVLAFGFCARFLLGVAAGCGVVTAGVAVTAFGAGAGVFFFGALVFV